MIDSLHKYPLFPDLLENQRRSVQYFWEKGILEELELFSYLSRSNSQDSEENFENLSTISGAALYTKNLQSLNSSAVRDFTNLPIHPLVNDFSSVPRGNKGNNPTGLGYFEEFSLLQLDKTPEELVSLGNQGKTTPSKNVWDGRKKTSNFLFSASATSYFSALPLTSPRSQSLNSTTRSAGSPATLGNTGLKRWGEYVKGIQKYRNRLWKKFEGAPVKNRENRGRFLNEIGLPSSKPHGLSLDLNGAPISTSRKFLSAARSEKNSFFSYSPVYCLNNAQSNVLFSLSLSQLGQLISDSTHSLSLQTIVQRKVGCSTQFSTAPKEDAAPEGSFFSPTEPVLSASASETERSASKVLIHGSKFLLKAPAYSQQEAIRCQKTYSVGLYIPIELVHSFPSNFSSLTKYPSFQSSSTPSEFSKYRVENAQVSEYLAVTPEYGVQGLSGEKTQSLGILGRFASNLRSTSETAGSRGTLERQKSNFGSLSLKFKSSAASADLREQNSENSVSSMQVSLGTGGVLRASLGLRSETGKTSTGEKRQLKPSSRNKDSVAAMDFQNFESVLPSLNLKKEDQIQSRQVVGGLGNSSISHELSSSRVPKTTSCFGARNLSQAVGLNLLAKNQGAIISGKKKAHESTESPSAAAPVFCFPKQVAGAATENPTWFYFGDIPLMTERGSFLINGAPRVLVNQIVRCPSVYFKLKLDPKNRRTYIASFLSDYGSWLRLETDRLRSRIWVRIDKSPRFPLDWLLSALGWGIFSKVGSGTQGNQNQLSKHSFSGKQVGEALGSSLLKTAKAPFSRLDVFNPKRLRQKTRNFLAGEYGNTGEGSWFPSLREGNQLLGSFIERSSIKLPKSWSGSLGYLNQRPPEAPEGKSSVAPRLLTHEATQLIWKKCNASRWTSLVGCYSFFYTKFFHPRRYSLGNVGRLCLNKRLGRNPECKVPTLTPEDVFLALDYLIQLQNGNESGIFHLDDIDHLKNRRVRLPGEIIQNQFRLALSRVASVVQNALNVRSKIPDPKKQLVVFGGPGVGSGSLGSLNQRPLSFRPALAQTGGLTLRSNRSSQISRGRSLAQMFGGSPPQTFVTTLRELFNTSQLSQYMDQTNPLAEITHKRRLSSLGPGGVGRDQAGFAVREIHPSHFGRICPIETPEGQNAGLVGSLASYARINSNGFLQSPAMSLISTPAQQKTRPIYLFAAEAEDDIYLCTADIGLGQLNSSALFDKSSLLYTVSTPSSLPVPKTTSCFGGPKIFSQNPGPEKTTSYGEALGTGQNGEYVPSRYKQEFITTSLKKIQYTGICPIQMISVATSLIPFLEHDDANRALMGSNMQRQAVPLLFPEKPFVGTGLEMQAARDSSTPLLTPYSGQVTFVDSTNIELTRSSSAAQLGSRMGESDEATKQPFLIQRYTRSNQSTSINQRPAVQLGEWVEKGDILADGSATHDGEVSLGKNILLAYMPWEGYNFEDAIVINERLVYEDVYSSLHIERYEVDIRNAQPIRLISPSFGIPGMNSIPRNLNQPAENAGVTNQGENAVAATNIRSVEPFSLEIGKDYITRDLDIAFGSRLSSRAAQNSSQVGPSGMKEEEVGAAKLNQRPQGTPEEFPVLREESSLALNESFFQINEGKQNLVSPSEAGGMVKTEGVFSVAAVPQTTSCLGEPRENSSEKIGEDSGTSATAGEMRGYESQIWNLDSEGIIRPGTWVKEGDILVGKITPTQRTKISSGQSPPEYRLLVAIFADGGSRTEGSLQIRLKNTSFKAGIGVRGRVIDCIVPWRKLKKSGASSEIRIHRNQDQAFSSTTRNKPPELDLERIGSPQARKSAPIQIFLAHKKRIQIGDKMSGRHGNKGIVSLILPPQDMPYTQDGKPVDVVLNPLGVPSRMNVGQVLETLLGLVSFAMGEIYRLMPFDEMYGASRSSGEERTFAENLSKPLEKKGTPIDNEANPTGDAQSSSSSQLLSLRPETSRSLVYSKLRNVRNLLGPSAAWFFDANNPGKTQIFDGRTGEVFHQPALVGYSYMFKLIHLVDDKIHARSTGPYSLVTQQPLGGRSKKGGQRLGEMEVWALEGFGAAYILQEFLTVKSDEIYSRNTFLLNLMKRKIGDCPRELNSPVSSSLRTPLNSSLERSGNNTILFGDSLQNLTSVSANQSGSSVSASPGATLKEFFSPSSTPLLRFSNVVLRDSRSRFQEVSKTNEASGSPLKFSNILSPSADDGSSLFFERAPQKKFQSFALRAKTESRVPESFRVLVNELQALCLSVYYNPDFRLSYPSLLGWDGVFLLASKKFPTSYELSKIKNIGVSAGPENN